CFVELLNYRKDGSAFWNALAIAPVRDDAGQLTHFVGVQADVTERKTSDALLESILNSVLDAVIGINEAGTILLFNQEAEYMFGYQAAEILGRNVRELMPEPYRSEHSSYLANYLKTGDAKVIGVGREVVGRRKDGSTFPAELAVNYFHLEQDIYF